MIIRIQKTFAYQSKLIIDTILSHLLVTNLQIIGILKIRKKTHTHTKK